MTERSICRFGCVLGWVKGSTSSIVFARWRQCALMGGHIAPSGKYDWTVLVRLRCDLMSKLLWLLVTFLVQEIVGCHLYCTKSNRLVCLTKVMVATHWYFAVDVRVSPKAWTNWLRPWQQEGM